MNSETLVKNLIASITNSLSIVHAEYKNRRVVMFIAMLLVLVAKMIGAPISTTELTWAESGLAALIVSETVTEIHHIKAIKASVEHNGSYTTNNIDTKTAN